VDSNLGWKGPEKYVAIVPLVFDLLGGPTGTLRHQHEQLLGPDLDRSVHAKLDADIDGYPREGPAASSAELWLHWSRHAFAVLPRAGLRERLQKEGIDSQWPPATKLRI
jgi:hypothetical protein